MKFDRQAIRAALARLPRPVAGRFGRASDSMLEWLRAKQAPPGLVEFFHEFAVRGDHLPDLTAYVYDDAQIQKYNFDEDFWAAGLLVIGSCGNGDYIVLDFTGDGEDAAAGAVGYVSHEELYSNPGDYRAVYVRVAEDFADFIHRLHLRMLPVDYYDAQPMRRDVLPDYRYGFIDRAGELAIDFRFNHTAPFMEGLASITLDGKHGTIDRSGRFVIEPRLNYLDSFFGGLAVAREEPGKYGFVDRNGRFVIAPRYSYLQRFSQGLAPARVRRRFRGEAMGYLRPDGGWAVEPVYESTGSFSDGLGLVEDRRGYSFIDPSGERVLGPYEFAEDFRGGVALVRKRGEEFLLRRDGTLSSLAAYGTHAASSYSSDDRVEVRHGKYVGYVDSYARLVIPPTFSAGATFREGRAAVKVRRRWGAIDAAGAMLIEPVYDESFWFRDGIAIVRREGKSLFIDAFGNILLRPRYEATDVFREGLAIVRTTV